MAKRPYTEQWRKRLRKGGTCKLFQQKRALFICNPKFQQICKPTASAFSPLECKWMTYIDDLLDTCLSDSVDMFKPLVNKLTKRRAQCAVSSKRKKKVTLTMMTVTTYGSVI